MFLDVCLLCSTGQGQNKTHENDEWPALSRSVLYVFTLLHSLPISGDHAIKLEFRIGLNSERLTRAAVDYDEV